MYEIFNEFMRQYNTLKKRRDDVILIINRNEVNESLHQTIKVLNEDIRAFNIHNKEMRKLMQG